MPTDYPYPIIERSLYGRTVSLLGCRHTKEFFDEYQSYFKQALQQTDALIMEQSFNLDFWEAEFFGKLGRIANQRRIPVYIVDPLSEQMGVTDIHLFAPAALLVGATSANIAQQAVKRTLTRRSFLRNALLGLGGLSLAAGSLGGLIARGALDDEALQQYGIDDVLAYGATDFRNIQIAEGLERISRDVPGLQSLLSIHGAAHYETVDAYLIAPELRLKSALYPLYAAIGDTRIREYRPTREGWELVGTV